MRIVPTVLHVPSGVLGSSWPVNGLLPPGGEMKQDHPFAWKRWRGPWDAREAGASADAGVLLYSQPLRTGNLQVF